MTQTSAPVLSPPFLLATDGSPSDQLAQKLLATIAQTTQANPHDDGRSLVTVLMVQPRRFSRSRRLPHTQEAQKGQGEAMLEQARAALSVPAIEVPTLRQTGDPGPLICQTAQQQQVDLIVLSGNVMQRWLCLPVGEGLFPLQSFRRSKPMEAGVVKQPPALRNTRLSAAEDYTLHHAPCSVLLCRSTHTAST